MAVVIGKSEIPLWPGMRGRVYGSLGKFIELSR